MRILVVSNLYPPHLIGGYEIGCQEVIDQLRARGHDVTVLTSTYGVEGPQVEGHVHRELQISSDLNNGVVVAMRPLFSMEHHNARAFRRLVRDTKPELIYCWNLLALSHRVLWSRPPKVPIAKFIFDDSLARWPEVDPWFHYWHRDPPGRLRQALKKVLSAGLKIAGVATDYGPPRRLHCQFASHYLKAEALRYGLPVADAPVIHCGIDLAQFPFRPTPSTHPRRVLFVGRLLRDKGVHLAVEALAILAGEHGRDDVTLTCAGAWADEKYRAEVTSLINRHNLQERVQFIGQVPRRDLWRVMHEHDVFIFPSCWEEPWGLALVEAMACGLAVVTTATGGNAEIVEPGISGLTAPADSPPLVAQALLEALDPARNEALRYGARQRVEQHLQLSQTADKLEEDLQALIDHKLSGPAGP